MNIVSKENDIYIIDDFLDDPYKSRDYALKLDYPLTGIYPGYRTMSPPAEFGDVNLPKFEEILGSKILQWPKKEWRKGTSNTQFHVAFNKAWRAIHWDVGEWSCVLYLSPHLGPEFGTTIWQNINTGAYSYKQHLHRHDELGDESQWRPFKVIENKFNRLAMYPSHYYHSGTTSGNGATMETARLTQVYFFTINEPYWEE